MANGQDYLTISTYEVKIDNVNAGSFVRVSGIGSDIEDVMAKDDAGKTYVNTPGSVNARDLTLTRRFSGDKSLYKWFEEVKTKGNQAKMRTGSVRLLNTEGKQVAQFDFDGAWTKSWVGPELTKTRTATTSSRRRLSSALTTSSTSKVTTACNHMGYTI